MSGLPNDLFAPSGDVTRAMVVQTLHNMEGNPPVYSGNFSDVAAGDWYSQAVKWAAANGITTGYGDGTFAPGKNITRQELAAMLYRYAQYKGMDAITLADYLGQFTDTDEIHAYAVSALNWAVGQGLMQGYNGELNPAGTATRAELAAILARFDRNVLPNLED